MNASTIATAIAALEHKRTILERDMTNWYRLYSGWSGMEEEIDAIDEAITEFRALQADSAAVGVDEDGLLPCPYCGGRADVLPSESGSGWIIWCDKCNLASVGFWKMQDAIDWWNRRATKDIAAAPPPVSEWVPVDEFVHIECECGNNDCGYVQNLPSGIRATSDTGQTVGVMLDSQTIRLCKRVAAPSPRAMLQWRRRGRKAE